ncbi:LmeA family phospholipid-binding protein [Mycobacterium sp. 1274761.0]|uniref:LmeA family phospholipid-binding protein n=1 Tax=Mycobacterium sp. 1274761.0 TaxID=1834077 RepID=UPI0007FD3679|nr:LmeA family phospholipid-binding protein [Mycobacterium sp. 1274761.0]OBK78772.1 hypothetical protein A5651_02310 [Mycobacterium sp. 1274761.0]
MTGPRPLRRWDVFRPLDMLMSVWSTAATAPLSTGATAAYRTLLLTLRRMVVGRELSVRLDEGDITLTVTEFDSRVDVRGLTVGQLSDVRLAARDIRWDTNRLDRATAVLHNVQLRPSALVAAPVDLTVELPAETLDDLFRLVAPRLVGEIDQDGIARLRLARRPSLGHLEVDAHLDDSTLWLKPRALVLRRKRLRLPPRTPAYRVQLPDLPHGLRLTDISFQPDTLCLAGTLTEWRIDAPRTRLEDVINQLSMVGRPLNLSRLARG